MTRWIHTGDQWACKSLYSRGAAELETLKRQMRLNGLDQGWRTVPLGGGTWVHCASLYGLETVTIHVPPVSRPEPEPEIDVPALYFEVRIDGQDLYYGGQNFTVRYTSLDGGKEKVFEKERTVAPDILRDKYGYSMGVCGPFIIPDLNRGKPVELGLKIHRRVERDETRLMTQEHPEFPFTDIEGHNGHIHVDHDKLGHFFSDQYFKGLDIMYSYRRPLTVQELAEYAAEGRNPLQFFTVTKEGSGTVRHLILSGCTGNDPDNTQEFQAWWRSWEYFWSPRTVEDIKAWMPDAVSVSASGSKCCGVEVLYTEVDLSDVQVRKIVPYHPDRPPGPPVNALIVPVEMDFGLLRYCEEREYHFSGCDWQFPEGTPDEKRELVEPDLPLHPENGHTRETYKLNGTLYRDEGSDSIYYAFDDYVLTGSSRTASVNASEYHMIPNDRDPSPKPVSAYYSNTQTGFNSYLAEFSIWRFPCCHSTSTGSTTMSSKPLPKYWF